MITSSFKNTGVSLKPPFVKFITPTVAANTKSDMIKVDLVTVIYPHRSFSFCPQISDQFVNRFVG
jgi:hypothetical protein